ncbi:MAG TPA: MFS transporter [Aliidongia sp.]|uniref:MFS transporter n=1 Tax=Aliidongia sp. TaxID=1914230 RepID=UPI002DDCA5D6|nr:MFS transporter [Aliidongia sp.]HEV2678340.1 MFS transporter [Aliidongia sp.]
MPPVSELPSLRLGRGEAVDAVPAGRSKRAVVSSLGIGQILAWSSSYYLTAVLPLPVAEDTGWAPTWTVGALSIGLLISGLVSPIVGRLIERHGGRPVLAVSAVLIAAGLAVLAAAPNLQTFIAGWIVIGLGMGAGLYDAVFSALGRLYGDGARSAISQVTLFGGFASSVSWPAGTYLVAHVGWRQTCLVFAAVDLVLLLPLYLVGLPRETRAVCISEPSASAVPIPIPARSRLKFYLLATSLTLASVAMAIISVHLLTLLRLFGVGAVVAVTLGTLLGPLQVGGRALEMSIGRNLHPVFSMIASTVLVAIGLALLFGDTTLIAIGIVILGVGSGIRSIVRGTLPLALFGREGYATLMGKLAVPTLLAQAAAPSAGAWLLEHFSPAASLVALLGIALLNVVSALLLLPFRHPA